MEASYSYYDNELHMKAYVDRPLKCQKARKWWPRQKGRSSWTRGGRTSQWMRRRQRLDKQPPPSNYFRPDEDISRGSRGKLHLLLACSTYTSARLLKAEKAFSLPTGEEDFQRQRGRISRVQTTCWILGMSVDGLSATVVRRLRTDLQRKAIRGKKSIPGPRKRRLLRARPPRRWRAQGI